MPIGCPIQLGNLSQSEFDERDAIVMRCAYDSQNALGRLCDERVYENDLARRLRASGFRDILTQVPVTVSHGSFEKEYRLDLVADDALYELKTVTAFVGEHDAQVLHYAMLLSVHHAKLLNFRNPRVEGRLRFNAVKTDDRHRMHIHDRHWTPIAPRCSDLKAQALALLHDWGGFLDFRLYEEALVHHFGGEPHVTVRTPLVYEGCELGTHRFCVHEPAVCFAVTGFADFNVQTRHLTRLLQLTNFRAMQWLNFHHDTLTLQTLLR
jgi:GxxExxY protein